MKHALVKLSGQIDWSAFEDKFGSFYVPRKGRPGLPIRLMVGLTYLSQMFDLSDEAVAAGWLENPYRQYFCGYEFGVKVGVVTTSRDNWVVGVQAFPGNPYDGHTLTSSLAQTEHLTGRQPKAAYVDLGYRGHGYQGETVIHIVNRRRRNFSRSERRWRNRRATVEPVIGPLKSDHRMERNYLKGAVGDQMNAMLAGCGRNLRKLRQILFRLFSRNPILVVIRLFLLQRTTSALHRTVYKTL